MSDTAEKKPVVHKSGGATFSPRLPDGQRPEYPSLASTLMKTGLEWLRSGVILSLLTYLVHPWYLKLLDMLMDPEGPTALDERGVFTLLSCACHTLIYIFWCGGIELMLFLGIWRDYQFERLPRQVPTAKLIARTLALAAVGQLIVTPLLLYYFAYFNFKRFGMPDLTAPLPDFWTLFRNYTVARVFNDWGFYWAHRIVHTKFLYKAIHKQHHLYTGSIPITAEFASLPETIFANTLPTIGGPLFFGMHPLVFFLWLMCRLQQTYEGHSGVCFVGTFWHRIGLTNGSSAADHDFHHSENRGNFGAFYLDHIFGTMDVYLAGGGEEGYCKRLRRLERKQAEAAAAKNQ